MFGIKAIGVLVVLLAIVSGVAYTFYLKAEVAEQQLSIAVEVNKANARAAKELREDWALEKVETEKELAAAQQRATAIEKVKQELQNAPEANTPAGPFFDLLGERLRSLNSGTAD